MNRTVLATLLTCFALACEEPVDEDNVESDTDADTSADTEVDTEEDTEADTDIVASCDEPIAGGPVMGEVFDDADVVADVTADDRCQFVVNDLTYDFSGTVYPAILAYVGDVQVAELWVEPRAYEMEDITVDLWTGAGNAPLWDGQATLTVNLADAIAPQDVWATGDVAVTE